MGILRHKRRERIVVRQQAFAHLLHALQKRIVRAVFAFQLRQKRADGFGIDIAHQAADVLPLAFHRTVGRDFLVFFNGFVQIFRKRDFLQRGSRKPGQLHAQILQFVHLFFLAGFADPFVLIFHIVHA